MTVQDVTMKSRAKGAARCPNAPSLQEIVAQDKVAAPEWVTSESYEFMGDEDISKDRYIDPKFAQLEYERLWTRTWQFACREEHIPEVGDYYVYDIGVRSFIITRVAGNEIRAYYNACLHRGTKLRASNTVGFASEFKCSFHGWSWNVDGTNKSMTCPWDFPHANPEEFKLPEAKVELLGGFVWINMDPDAPTLAEYLGEEALNHIKAWKLEDRYVALHVAKRLSSNWKLAMDAFHEAYHVIQTHPQVAMSGSDANSQYDTYGDHVNRFITAMGKLSPHLYGQYSEQDVLDQFTLGDSSALGDTKLTLKEGETAREVMCVLFRDMFGKMTNSDLSKVSDSEIVDCFSYTFFPNCFLFPGISLPLVYRFRPDPRDHTKCLYEVMFLHPMPVDGTRPETAELIQLADDQSFMEAEGMDPAFGHILDQDTDLVDVQQQGLATTVKPGLTLGNYQEIRIRHFEGVVDKYLAMEPPKRDWHALQRR